MDANAYIGWGGEGGGGQRTRDPQSSFLKDDPLTRLGIVFPRTRMALRGARIIRMTPRICGSRMHAHASTHTSPTRLADTSKIAN